MPCAFFTPTLNFRDSCSIWHHGLITWGDIWPKVYILENLLLLFCQYSLSFWINWSGCETLKCHGLKTTKKKIFLLSYFFPHTIFHLLLLTVFSPFKTLLTIPTDRRWVKCARSINQAFSYHSDSSMLPVRKYKGRNTGDQEICSPKFLAQIIEKERAENLLTKYIKCWCHVEGREGEQRPSS